MWNTHLPISHNPTTLPHPSTHRQLLNLPEPEQCSLLTKLQKRLVPRKKRKSSRGRRKKKMSEEDKPKAASKKQQEEQVKGQQEQREWRLQAKHNTKQQQLKGKIGWAAAEAGGWMQDDAARGPSSLFRSGGSERVRSVGRVQTRNRQDVDHDYLNCGVPDSVRSDLKKRGVRLPKGSYEVAGVAMGAQLRNTKTTYNKMWEGACTREDSRKCGSFADLTLPGTDRAMRLKRLSAKTGFK
jgi:hypothetical protein